MEEKRGFYLSPTVLLVMAFIFGLTAASNAQKYRFACGFRLVQSIYNKWIQLGGTRSVLGCPVMNEAEAGESPQGTRGRFAHFKYGIIITHDNGPFRGKAFELHGEINKYYLSTGGTNGKFGFPIKEEHKVPRGKRCDFEGGYILWSDRLREIEAHYSR